MMMTSDKKDIFPQTPGDQAGHQPDADPLARYFDAARASSPELGAGLRARILADASASMAPSPRPRKDIVFWRNWFSGWAAPGLAGGATVAIAGFWIGISMPMPVVALDAPQWMEGALSYMDLIAVQFIGLDDPLLMEF